MSFILILDIPNLQLHECCSRTADESDAECISLLIGAGACVNCTTVTGSSPLHLAARAGNMVALALLIEKVGLTAFAR